jgi:hypothetical protein
MVDTYAVHFFDPFQVGQPIHDTGGKQDLAGFRVRSVQQSGAKPFARAVDFHHGAIAALHPVRRKLVACHGEKLRGSKSVASQETVYSMGSYVPRIPCVHNQDFAAAAPEDECSTQSSGSAADDQDVK